jgi:glyceraldehyde-3-phosphate dehydrogenase/erythrose-4-phosphate dehydrogenase
VIPYLEGRLDGVVLRVPVVDGSLVDLAVLLERDSSGDDINAGSRRRARTVRSPDGCATRPSRSCRAMSSVTPRPVSSTRP